MTGTYAYDVFGAVRAQSGATTEWSYRGEQHDPTGLQYLRARYYDATTGWFVSRDPLPLLQRYTYAGNNPAMFVDPYGLCGWSDPWNCPGDAVAAMDDVVTTVAEKSADVITAVGDEVGSRVGAVAVVGLDTVNALYQTGAAITTDEMALSFCLMGFELGAEGGPLGAVGGCVVGAAADYLQGQLNTAPQRAVGQSSRFAAMAVKSTVGGDYEGSGALQVPPGAQVDPNVGAILAWQAWANDLPWAWHILIHGR